MKGLDTNVLVRYLTQDEPSQAAIAAEEIEQAAAKAEKMLIQPLVLCELVWVLETAYDFGKAEILGFSTRSFGLESSRWPIKTPCGTPWRSTGEAKATSRIITLAGPTSGTVRRRR